ncbi:DUF4926 domain-containing protein [Candidatus Viridilinea mediisalina]|uniref:DUF4926 domain-containing protein n=1 Tax=Candidatus Viridilinea mediisalina TaxID=2024553 RepID=A0A2A6RHZ6_9CHLR|nr:DUF4926 domain-containing protein [Candidatus Viridilinea mediisalina]PDW02571.1 DUF4926 domain-containing protein [Candidatus Viridilinea mediisalina]
MVQELDLVVLTKDIHEYGLERGDIGTVVHIYQDRKNYEVEFVTSEGATIAVLTLSEHDIRSRASREILHVREVATVG